MSRFSGTECSGRDDRRCFSERQFNWEWDCFNAEAQRRGETQRGLVCARMR